MITFKLAQNKQIESICKMMQEFYAIDHYPIDVAVTKKLVREFLSDKNLGTFWLIYNDNELVGYVVVTFVFSFEYAGKIAFLDELYISENNRGKGIGKETIAFIKEELKALNVKLVYLEVEHHNENAQKLYLANDFEIHNRKLLKFKL